LGARSDPAEAEAHSLSRSVLTRDGVLRPEHREQGVLRRFEAGERDQISSLDAVLTTARRMATASETSAQDVVMGLLCGFSGLNWPLFVSEAGGLTVFDALAARSGVRVNPGALANRYLVSCRCGMIDMRHFYQLMYIAIVRNNRYATALGREHELQAEPTSRF